MTVDKESLQLFLGSIEENVPSEILSKNLQDIIDPNQEIPLDTLTEFSNYVKQNIREISTDSAILYCFEEMGRTGEARTINNIKQIFEVA